MFEIEKGVPVPAGKRGGGRKAIYPFDTMSVGDSFAVPRDKGVTKAGGDVRQSTVSSCARLYARKHNPSAKFTVRVVDENTLRCWRIA